MIKSKLLPFTSKSDKKKHNGPLYLKKTKLISEPEKQKCVIPFPRVCAADLARIYNSLLPHIRNGGCFNSKRMRLCAWRFHYTHTYSRHGRRSEPLTAPLALLACNTQCSERQHVAPTKCPHALFMF